MFKIKQESFNVVGFLKYKLEVFFCRKEIKKLICDIHLI